MDNPKIIITSGDPDGVGPEVTIKALLSMGPSRTHQYVIFCSASDRNNPWKHLEKKFKVHVVASWNEALLVKAKSPKDLCLIRSHLAAPHWIGISAAACVTKAAAALVTAPLSKELIRSSGIQHLGHTEILKEVSYAEDVFMGFVGSKFNVVLATGHMPLKMVSGELSQKVLLAAMDASLRLAKLTAGPTGRKVLKLRPVGVLGLNPHAGNSGLIGNEEDLRMKPILDEANRKEVAFVGPLPPDSAFVKSNWNRYSCYLALYHDQGLIPFKCVHGFDSGVHVTLGLPFVRTSVDHGTAKDIFGKNKANPRSMIEAIRFAEKASRIEIAKGVL